MTLANDYKEAFQATKEARFTEHCNQLIERLNSRIRKNNLKKEEKTMMNDELLQEIDEANRVLEQKYKQIKEYMMIPILAGAADSSRRRMEHINILVMMTMTNRNPNHIQNKEKRREKENKSE